MENRDKIVLCGMKFFGWHGVLEEERSRGQEFLIDVEMRTNLAAAGTQDDLRQTINYAEVAGTVKKLAEKRPGFLLIEALAEAIAGTLLREHAAKLREVTVRVHKPQAPIGVPAADVFVEVTREQGGNANF